MEMLAEPRLEVEDTWSLFSLSCVDGVGHDSVMELRSVLLPGQGRDWGKTARLNLAFELLCSHFSIW